MTIADLRGSIQGGIDLQRVTIADLRGSIQGGIELQRGVGAVLQPNKADSMSKQALIRGVLGQEGLFYIRIKDYLVINQGNTRKMQESMVPFPGHTSLLNGQKRVFNHKVF